MIKYNLTCKCGEIFESWFSSSAEFDSLCKKKLIKCIYCESSLIKKSVMAPNLSHKSNKIYKKKKIKKNGIMFVSTINKNLKSYIFAILGAEYILRWLPIGTHDWDKFLTPQNLKNIVCNNNFLADETVGMKFNIFSNRWNKSNDTSVNYISTFLKN